MSYSPRSRASSSSDVGLGVVLGIFGLFWAILTSIVRGFTLAVLWDWFVRNLFTNAPDLSVINAIGLSLIVSFLTYQFSEADIQATNETDGVERFVRNVIIGIVYYSIIWIVAIIIHVFQ